MVKYFWICIALCLSISIQAKKLDNNHLYTVPSDQVWVVRSIERNHCDVCTSDIYVQKGNAKLNEVSVSGSFDFSLMINTKVLFESNTVFALGDIVKSMNVDVVSTDKVK